MTAVSGISLITPVSAPCFVGLLTGKMPQFLSFLAVSGRFRCKLPLIMRDEGWQSAGKT
jgi:hypothetical protein